MPSGQSTTPRSPVAAPVYKRSARIRRTLRQCRQRPPRRPVARGPPTQILNFGPSGGRPAYEVLRNAVLGVVRCTTDPCAMRARGCGRVQPTVSSGSRIRRSADAPGGFRQPGHDAPGVPRPSVERCLGDGAYLHNGSVPTLAEFLKPPAQRRDVSPSAAANSTRAASVSSPPRGRERRARHEATPEVGGLEPGHPFSRILTDDSVAPCWST